MQSELDACRAQITNLQAQLDQSRISAEQRLSESAAAAEKKLQSVVQERDDLWVEVASLKAQTEKVQGSIRSGFLASLHNTSSACP
jgi:SMC interacting uncharacterized protein involved in chromosome segregation